MVLPLGRARARRRAGGRRGRRARRSPLRLGRDAGQRQAAARAELTAELVELLRGAPELVAYGHEERDAGARPRRRPRARPLGRRDALVAGLADALSMLVAGLTAVGVLAVAVAAHDAGSLDRVLVATLALLALASFDAVRRCPRAARELSATLAAGRRVLELTDREPRGPRSRRPVPPAGRRRVVALEDVTARYGRRRAARARRLRASARAGRASRSSARAARARRRSRTCCYASSTRRAVA